MRKKWIIFLLIAVIVGASTVLFIITDRNKDTDAKESPVNILDDFDQIITINVTAMGEEIELKRDEGTWNVQNVERKQNNNKVTSFVEAMNELEGDQVEISRESVKFDSPEVTVAFQGKDGSQQTIAIGQLHSDGKKYYIQHVEKNEIYLVDRELVETIPLQSAMLLDSAILTISPSEVENIIIDNGTEQYHLTKESPYSKQESLAHISGWYVKEPYHSVYSVAYSKMEAILAGMEQLQKTEIVDDVSKLGEVDFRITFQTSGHTETLLIGDPAPDQKYYAKLEGTEEVFTIGTRTLDPYSHPPFELTDHFVHIVPLEYIQSIEVTSSEHNWIITGTSEAHELNEDGEFNKQFTVNDNAVSTEAVQEAYKSLAGLSFDSVVKNESNIAENKELTITYNTGSQYVIDFYSMNDTYFSYQKNNEGFDFLIEKEKVYKALDEIEQVLLK
ncbi:protein of unknown function [Gracilibacillus ureilyticus]|uniref:DUF4340 domain-containing protein n=1 Tax=Gracilibacillus ureilyticus TaxID=531814 RepID=A0A1H9PT07_9BACI|nr:DUF4340 domain-containing protein [Gracilibacillus ureilyticus]SER51268.1 protein of unknown function [Gracilibacillus ureilyticus]